MAIYQFCLVTTVTSKENKTTNEKKKARKRIRRNKVDPKIQTRNEYRCDTKSMYINEHYFNETTISAISEESDDYENFTSRSRGESEGSFGRSRVNSSVFELATKISDAESCEERDEMAKRKEIHKQLFQSFTTLFMQDGPFLILRLYVIINFNIKSEMHLFFTCKNLIVILLQLYRLFIIYTTRNEQQNAMGPRGNCENAA